MAIYTIPQRFAHRRGTYTELYQRNEILKAGEECFETHDVDGLPLDPWLCKVGDGSTPWNDLEYQTDAAAGGGGDANIPAVMARISLRF